MTNAELNALEKAANIAKGRSGEKDFFGMNSGLVIFYAMVSPETILELITDLRQAQANLKALESCFAAETRPYDE